MSSIECKQKYVKVVAKGSFREVGQMVGEETRELIRFMREVMVPDLLKNVFAGDETAMVRAATLYNDKVFEYFPNAHQYIRGLAEGANMYLTNLLPIVYCEELSAEPAQSATRDRCSTMVVWTDKGWVIGHQEDFWRLFLAMMIIYDLHFDGYPRMVSLGYPATFPGIAGSLNSAGVAIVNNALWPKAGQGISKQARHFRATLETTLEGAYYWLACGPHMLTDHFIVAGGQEGRLVSLEVSNPVVSPLVSASREIVYKGKPVSGKSVMAPFVHANHVQWLPLLEEDPGHIGSYMRLGKLYAEACRNPPKNTDDMLQLLIQPDGILRKMPERNLTTQENSLTLATTVISPSERKIIFVRYGEENPAVEEFAV